MHILHSFLIEVIYCCFCMTRVLKKITTMPLIKFEFDCRTPSHSKDKLGTWCIAWRMLLLICHNTRKRWSGWLTSRVPTCQISQSRQHGKQLMFCKTIILRGWVLRYYITHPSSSNHSGRYTPIGFSCVSLNVLPYDFLIYDNMCSIIQMEHTHTNGLWYENKHIRLTVDYAILKCLK